MSRYIDADVLIENLKNDITGKNLIDLYNLDGFINAQPTVDAVHFTHGKWIWDDEGYHCSECWYHAQGNTLECMTGEFEYCPRCGAQMGKEKV